MITFGNFAVSKATAFNIWEIPYFVVIGCGGGLIGAAFNHLNKLLTKWRLDNVNTNSKLRFLEVLVVIYADWSAARVTFAAGCPRGGSVFYHVPIHCR